MRNMLNLKMLGVEINNALEQTGMTKIAFAATLGISRQTLDNYISKNNMPLDVFNLAVSKYPNIANIFNIESVASIQSTKKIANEKSHKGETEIQINFQNNIIEKGDTIGIQQIDTTSVIDTSRVYYITTTTTSLIKYLERDTTDTNLLHCHTPGHPSFTLHVSDILELHLIIYKISSL